MDWRTRDEQHDNAIDPVCPPGTPDGRHAIDGERMFAMPQSYETAPATEKKLETHRRYIDIQYLISGEEIIHHAPAERLVVTEPYNDERDVVFYQDPVGLSATLLRPGDFTIYFPHDGHKGGCMNTTPVAVRKVVIKIAV